MAGRDEKFKSILLFNFILIMKLFILGQWNATTALNFVAFLFNRKIISLSSAYCQKQQLQVNFWTRSIGHERLCILNELRSVFNELRSVAILADRTATEPRHR